MDKHVVILLINYVAGSSPALASKVVTLNLQIHDLAKYGSFCYSSSDDGSTSAAKLSGSYLSPLFFQISTDAMLCADCIVSIIDCILWD